MKRQNPFEADLLSTNLAASWLVVSILFFSPLWAPAAEVSVQAWVQRYSHTTDADDRARKVVTDSLGNVIVAGYTDGKTTGQDMLVIKYSGAGVPLWTNRYNGPGNGNDYLSGLAVDIGGKVLITGPSIGNSGSYEFATVAYSEAGVPLWTNRYHGSGNDDQAQAVAVDAIGNVFVIGQSLNGGYYDYTTIKYSGAGIPLWTNLYHGPDSGDDEPQALAVDSSGNVFVTGYLLSNISFSDYATIGYSGAGIPLWTNRYNGPDNSYDQAYAVAVDSAGNVFVTGLSDAGGSSEDYATIKYSAAGVPLWTNRYNGPGNLSDVATAVAVDASGNVFVTGFSAGGAFNDDYATIKYSGAGVPFWTNRYNGPSNGDDIAQALAVDGSGKVFVTGYSLAAGSSGHYVTIEYSATGLPLWTNRYHGPGNGYDYAYALALDGNGNLFVTGSSVASTGGNDCATIKYSGTGVPLWTNRYNGPANSDDIPQAVAVDSNGNVFVTGYSLGSGSSADYATIGYSAAGLPLWTNRYNGPGNSDDNPQAIAVDNSGNVVITGSSVGSGTSGDFATIKYSGAGLPLWTNRYNGPANSNDLAQAMAIDRDGDVFVTGSSPGSGSSADYATIKYSGAGSPLWTNRYNGPGNGDDIARAVALDVNGNVFVTGYSMGSGSGYDCATIKYSTAGLPLWTNRYNGPLNGNDYALAIAVDGNNNVFVAGGSEGGSSDRDYVTIAYSGTGVPLWTNRYNGPGNGSDQAQAVAVDGSGNVLITGSAVGSAGDFDYTTIKYSASGAPLWTNRYNGPANGIDSATAVAVDRNGNVVVTGRSSNSSIFTASTNDYLTIKYSPAGVPLWTNRYNGPANGNDAPLTKQSLALGPDASVYVIGASDGDYSANNNVYDFATIKYVSVPSLTIERDGASGFFINFYGSPNATYLLQRAPALTGTWSNIATTTVLASGLAEYHEPAPAPAQALYRALLVQ